jgi:hypothetical protein
VPFAARPAAAAGALTTVAFPESRWSMTPALTSHPHARARTNAPPSLVSWLKQAEDKRGRAIAMHTFRVGLAAPRASVLVKGRPRVALVSC